MPRPGQDAQRGRENEGFKANEAGFLENLINFKLQLQEAKDVGIRVSDADLKDAIDGIKNKYKMTEVQFQESLKAEGYSLMNIRSICVSR